jgi:hypothetical protein
MEKVRNQLPLFRKLVIKATNWSASCCYCCVILLFVLLTQLPANKSMQQLSSLKQSVWGFERALLHCTHTQKANPIKQTLR